MTSGKYNVKIGESISKRDMEANEEEEGFNPAKRIFFTILPSLIVYISFKTYDFLCD